MIQSLTLSTFILLVINTVFTSHNFLSQFANCLSDERIPQNRTVYRDSINSTTCPSLIKTQIKSELRQVLLSIFFFSQFVRSSFLRSWKARSSLFALASFSHSEFSRAADCCSMVGRSSVSCSETSFTRWQFKTANQYANIVPQAVLFTLISWSLETMPIDNDQKKKFWIKRQSCPFAQQQAMSMKHSFRCTLRLFINPSFALCPATG